MTEGREIQVEEGGYARIHNAILEVLAKARLSGAEFRCIHFLLRKTYGWGKKEDRISLSQWAEGTDTKRPHVLSTLNGLIKKNIIYRRLDSGQIPTYGFNKYIEQWQGIGVDSERGKRFLKEEVLPEQVTVPKQVTVTRAGNSTVTSTGNKTVTKAGTHKRKKETLKESSEHQSMFGLLVRICMIDPKLKGGQIGRTAKALLAAEYLPPDLENFDVWWKEKDFRGQRGEPPTLGQVVDKIAQSKADQPARNASKTVQVIMSDGAVLERTA